MLVRADDIAPEPWRNGRGRTRELLARPQRQDWRVRISVADVETDASFSSFAGVTRWFAVLKGAGVELSVDGQTRRLVRGDAPFAFDGGANTACRLLDGPTRDLNLMLSAAPGRMLLAADGVPWRPALAHCGLFSAVAGRCGDVEVPAYALLWFERAPREGLAFVAAQRPAAAIGWWIEAGSTP